MAVVDAYTALNLVNPVYASGQTQTATSTNIVISDGFTTSNYQGTGFTFSATAVTGGSRLVEDAARTLAAISKAVDADSTSMQDIAASSQAQSQAVAIVFSAMRQMDEVAQDNAALVEQTNAAIEQTQAQAGELDTIVGAYSTQRRDPLPLARAG